jgi:hypothetical protein
MFSCKDTAEELPDLTGTSWKLAGIVNVETGELRELASKDCAECYMLTFHTAHEASGGIANIDLSDLRKYMGTDDLWEFPDRATTLDVNHYRSLMISIESFTVTSDELKLFYNNKTEYLLFKLLEQ